MEVHVYVCDGNGNPSNQHYTLEISEKIRKDWIMHPETDVDLCAVDITDIFNLSIRKEQPMHIIPFDMTNIPSILEIENLNALEDVLTIGYPNGMIDKANNKPIFRRGITATDIKNNYENKAEFLIDSAIYKGSSGSPVVIANNGTFMDRHGDIHIGSRFYLLGIIYSVFFYAAKGEIKPVPISQTDSFSTKIPNNLGVVIKSVKLLDFINL